MNAMNNTARKLAWFALAGNATMTIRGRRTGTRFTFRVRIAEGQEHGPWFVQVLTGPENTSSYTYLGMITTSGEFRTSRKATISTEAPSFRMFSTVWARVLRLADRTGAGQGVGVAEFISRIPETEIPEIEVFHAGKCCRCGRKLTTPESVLSGIGPDCASKW